MPLTGVWAGPHISARSPPSLLLPRAIIVVLTLAGRAAPPQASLSGPWTPLVSLSCPTCRGHGCPGAPAPLRAYRSCTHPPWDFCSIPPPALTREAGLLWAALTSPSPAPPQPALPRLHGEPVTVLAPRGKLPWGGCSHPSAPPQPPVPRPSFRRLRKASGPALLPFPHG